jgi:uncharacterized protein YgiM (DUF1202 family)
MRLQKISVRLTAGLLLISTMIAPALAATGTVDSGNEKLRLRSAASTGSAVLTNLADGTQVEVTGATDGWYQVSYQGLAGFVSSEFLKVEGDVPAIFDVAAPADERLYGKVTASSLNIRSSPDVESEKVGSLKAGKVVELLETLQGWYRIEQGYVSADYVTQVDAATAASASKGQEIADYALSFLGARYVYGGSGP